MSLQLCPICKKNNSYWRIYKEINFKRYKKGMGIECEFCKQKMELEIGERSKSKMLCTGIIWMGLPIILIYLAYIGMVSYLMAIIYVTAFHFIAMYYIIKKMNYKTK